MCKWLTGLTETGLVICGRLASFLYRYSQSSAEATEKLSSSWGPSDETPALKVESHMLGEQKRSHAETMITDK